MDLDLDLDFNIITDYRSTLPSKSKLNIQINILFQLDIVQKHITHIIHINNITIQQNNIHYYLEKFDSFKTKIKPK